MSLEKREPAGPAGLAGEINAEHLAFVGSLKRTAEHGIRCGELLTQAKEQCPHGTWLDWLGNNFRGSARSAQVYMQMYKKRDEIRAKAQSSALLSISGALEEISAPKEEEDPEREEKIAAMKERTRAREEREQQSRRKNQPLMLMEANTKLLKARREVREAINQLEGVEFDEEARESLEAEALAVARACRLFVEALTGRTNLDVDAELFWIEERRQWGEEGRPLEED